MKTLKISVVATLAWRLKIPHAVWPAHPQMADFVLALITCVILQIAWTDSKKEYSDQATDKVVKSTSKN